MKLLEKLFLAITFICVSAYVIVFHKRWIDREILLKNQKNYVLLETYTPEKTDWDDNEVTPLVSQRTDEDPLETNVPQIIDWEDNDVKSLEGQRIDEDPLKTYASEEIDWEDDDGVPLESQRIDEDPRGTYAPEKIGWDDKDLKPLESQRIDEGPLEIYGSEKPDWDDNDVIPLVSQRADEDPLETYESEKIDWHDHEFMLMESRRTGLGEQGRAAKLPSNHDNNKCNGDEVHEEIGYNGCLSDYISVNRSLPDLRPIECREMKYRRRLPTVSVIIPVYNEYWSVLLRAIYSILNRTPAELLEDLILVDDKSSSADMKERLDNFVAEHLPDKVRVLRITSFREGLMAARLLGAQSSRGEILIFLDSNLEVNNNWLPPLIEPIAENYRTCVCPVIDKINDITFEVQAMVEFRGGFDWELQYRYFPRIQENETNPTKPFKSPVMVGCAFAISASFFWELGGYDRGLKIWGGEQYELSFKVWQCGGMLVDAPCSRVAHIFRGLKNIPYTNTGIRNFVGKNLKRVAEVWMDEYAPYVYSHRPIMKLLYHGDVGEQRAIRQKLQCKPFKWFMEEVAFDILKRYPLIDPPDYGSGKIVPVINDTLCLTVHNGRTQLVDCFTDENNDYLREFLLSWHKDIEVRGPNTCLTVQDNGPKAAVTDSRCHREMKDQVWRYDPYTQQLIHGLEEEQCLDFDMDTKEVYVDICDGTSKTQKWIVSSIDMEALKKWKETEPLL